MRILHTSDWHVGVRMRGRSRLDEHTAVLDEIVSIVDRHDVDVVVVAGDCFESSAPTPEADALVWQTFLRIAARAHHLIVITGNHDNAKRFAALAPLLELGGVTVVSEPVRPADGGTRTVDVAGTPLRIAALPFVSQRSIVRADELMAAASYEHRQHYTERYKALVDVLTEDFDADAVNLLVGHAHVVGGAAGGGERAAHVRDEYAIPATVFPAAASYVALGHLHRAQKIPGATAIHYCGAPLALDFGEDESRRQVNLIDVEPGLPAAVTAIPIESGRPLRTLRGSVEELAAHATADRPASWVRAVVTEPRRVDLHDRVRELFGDDLVEVLVDAPSTSPTERLRTPRAGRSPLELFDAFCSDQNIEDERLHALFAELLEDHA